MPTDAEPFQVNDLERLFCCHKGKMCRRHVIELDASRWCHLRDSARTQKQRDILLIQIQQVTETVVKNAWLTGPEKIQGRERLCRVAKGISVFCPEPLKRYNPLIKGKFLRAIPFREGIP
jgi:hypothetical protein